MPVWTPEPTSPAPVPLTSTLGERVWRRVPGFMREADDGTLWALCVAAGEPVEDQVLMVSDPGMICDPDRVPFDRLPWLAAMVGVDLASVPVGERRLVVADPDWRYRGTDHAIALRVGMTLTGARQVTIACPYLGDPWSAYVATLASETPDSAATLAAIDAECPAWLRVTYEARSGGKTYAALSAAYATYAVMQASGKSYGQLAEEA